MTDEPHGLFEGLFDTPVDGGPITGQTPALFEIHRPREGRKARNWGVFFGGLALLIAAVVGVPAVVIAGRHQDRYNRELSCRAQISNATTAINAALIADQTDLFLAVLAKGDTAPSATVLTADRALATRLKPIQLNAVVLCHQNPDYDVSKGTP